MRINRIPMRLITFCLLILLFVSSTLTIYAQGLLINISPGSGPPGTVFTITSAGGGFEGFAIECTVNGSLIGRFDYFGLAQNYQVPFDAASGASYSVYCYQPDVPDSGPFAGSAVFFVTVSDGDGDGVPDGQDSCPQQFGQTQNGCPDSDGDGFVDLQDVCPQQFGVPPTGCPDSDGDSVPDDSDLCPQQFSQIPNGCPDSDGDTVTDNQDLCPQQFAQTPNGCPLPTATTLAATATPNVVAPTPAPTTPAGIVRAAPPPEFPEFDECVDLRVQAQSLSITEIIRISVSDNPCANLTEVLRRQSFGGNLPSPLSQPRSAELRCSLDPRPVPSADFMWLDTNYARFGSQIRLSWAGVSDEELCAAMAGDPFRLVNARNVLAPLERAEYYTGVCYGILTAAQMRDAMNRIRAGADSQVMILLLGSLNNSSRFVGQSVWCSYLQQRILNISQADIDQQNALLNRLVDCRIIQRAEVDIWRVRISEGQAGFTWNDLAQFIGSLGNRCMSNQDFLMFIASGGTYLTTITTFSLPAATAAPLVQLFEPGSATDLIDLLAPIQTTTQTTNAAACPTDNRSLPTPEMQTLLDRLRRMNGGANTGSGSGLISEEAAFAIFLGQLSESGVCAAMLGDPFGMVSGLAGSNDQIRYMFWTTACLGGPIIDREYGSSALTQRVLGDPRTAGVISAISTASGAERARLWCAHVNSIINDRAASTIPPDLQELFDYVGQCFNLTRTELENLYTTISNSGGIAAGLPFQIPFSMEQFISVIDSLRVENPNRCPTPDEIVTQLRGMMENQIITEMSAEAELAATSSVFGIVYDVVCNAQDTNFIVGGRVPQGCVPRNNGTFLEANTSKDRFEQGIAGLIVEVYQGTCNQSGGGEFIGTAITDLNGYFQVENLQQRPHCIRLSWEAGANSTVLREGQWWTFAGVGGTDFYFNVIPSPNTVGSIAPIPAFGWWRAEASGVTTRSGSGEDMPEFYIAADTISAEAATYVPGVRVTFNVFRAYCEPGSWDGTLENVPPGCQIRSDGRLVPDDMQQVTRGAPPNDYEERGVSGVWVAIYDGDCREDAPDYTVMTGPDGRGEVRLPFVEGGTPYCIVVDAALPANAEALGAGRWVHTPVAQSVSRLLISGDFRGGLEFVVQWWLTGTGIPADDAPIPTPPGGGAGGSGRAGSESGIAPIRPVRDAAACPPGTTCTPTVVVGRPAVPNAAVNLPTASSAPRTLVNPPSNAPAPSVAAQIDSLIGTDWRTASIDSAERGVFIGRTPESDVPNLYLLEGGNIFDIGDSTSAAEFGASLSPDGRLLVYVGRGADDSATLFMLDVESGAYQSLFSDGLGIQLTNDPAAWGVDGQSVYFTATGANGTSIYRLSLGETGAQPNLFLANASQPSVTEDGLLMAFVREGEIVVRFLDTGDEFVLTEGEAGSICESPFFDANGIDLYFICRQGGSASLFRQGATGLNPIDTLGDALVTAGAGPETGTLLYDDGATVYLAAGDGSNAAPFIQLPDLRITGLRWGW